MKISLKEFKGRFDQAGERTAGGQWKLLSLRNRKLKEIRKEPGYKKFKENYQMD